MGIRRENMRATLRICFANPCLASLGHITGAYPLGLRPALREIASLRSATSDTPQPLSEMASQKMGGH